MGMFSWFTSDTQQQIRVDQTFNIHMTGSDGQVFHLTEVYEGYGVFGGRDYFSYLAELNKLPNLTGDDDDDRHAGIDLYYSSTPHEKPRLFAEIESLKKNVTDFPAPKDDPDQGWFNADEEECSTCGYPNAECECCGECGTYPCECENTDE